VRYGIKEIGDATLEAVVDAFLEQVKV
jgi:hypothetical protein